MDDKKRDESHAAPAGGAFYLVLVVLTSWRLLPGTLRLVDTIVRRFFIDQFLYRRALRSGSAEAPAIRNIEHSLDARIPVRYEKIEIYLGFVQMWISALSYIRRREGRRFNGAILEFIIGLERCYIDAASVYGQCLSTTRRPAMAPNPRLAFVYAVDPHLFCVPSLHVLVVCYTYRKLEDILAASGLSVAYSAELKALRDRAIAITESILYVRQHSVNCIPTALTMLSVILPSYGEVEARAFLSELFRRDGDISEADRDDALGYMLNLYDRIAGSGITPGERYRAIVDFLMSYEEPCITADCGESPDGSRLANLSPEFSKPA